ncbi:response regulator transcription factor [Phascolarctobacterium sp.]
MRLLFVEDEPDLREVLKKQLQSSGYSVDACGDGLEALDYMQLTAYDAIILDIMLPGLDGLSVLQKMRTAGDKTPVLLLTARGSVEDRVAGLDLGADDYLVKPFAFDELVARLRVLLRRSSGQVSNVLRCGDLEMDLSSRSVSRGGRELQLSAKEFAVLEYLLRNQGVVLTRETIENHVWDYDFEGGSNVVDVYIRYLRKKVDDGFEKKLIQTVRGTGYVLKETL